MNRYTLYKLVSSVSILAIILSAGASGALASTAPAATPALTAQALDNAEYPVELAPGGKAKLAGGAYKDEASGVAVLRIRPTASGGLNGDKAADAVVTLSASGGGSGVFTYLAAVLNDGGQARPVASVLLGDRIRMRSVRISKGVITVSFLDRRYDQPMSARPTVAVTRRFRLAAENLVALTPLTNADLNNATYPLDLVGPTALPFSNGRYADPDNRITAQILARPRAAGDLNGDGTPDSAVILWQNGGGSGVFLFLSAVINQANIAQPITGVLLGDRISVTGLAIRSGQVAVTLLDRKPGEPMAVKPSVTRRLTFKLEGGQLALVEPEAKPAPESAPAAASPVTPTVGTLADVLAADPDYSVMARLVKTTGLEQMLRTKGPYTLFVPDDGAFARLDQDVLQGMLNGDVQQVTDIVLYHIVKGRLGNLGEAAQTDLETALPGARIRAVVSEGGIYLDGRAWIQRYGVPASNGEIEELYSVALPPMPVTRRLALDGRFKTLVALIKEAGLAETLDMQLVNFTLFAPTDDAFARLPAGAVDQWRADPKLLATVLQYHIVTPTLMSSDLVSRTQLQAVYNGYTLPVAFDGGWITVKDARVVDADILAPGGVVHAVDAVLAPAEAAGAQSPAAPVTPTLDVTGTLPGILTGTVTYRQRIALDPKSVIQVTLSDVSKADAPAELIAGQDIDAGDRSVPFPFLLKYDPARIDPGHTYAVQARISVDGALKWINTTAYLVLTRGNPVTGVEIVVQPVK